MKFLADMGISLATVLFLRERDHDAVHLVEQRLHRLPDSDIIVKAREEARIILTHDLDFSALMAASGAKLPSVILFRLSDMRPDTVNKSMALILQNHADALQQGAIFSVNETQIRVRPLPIE